MVAATATPVTRCIRQAGGEGVSKRMICAPQSRAAGEVLDRPYTAGLSIFSGSVSQSVTVTGASASMATTSGTRSASLATRKPSPQPTSSTDLAVAGTQAASRAS